MDVKQGKNRDAVLYSVGANSTHGQRRTNADKRRAVETLLRDDEWGKWSNAEIARRCCVDEKTIRNYRPVTSEVPKSDLTCANVQVKTKHGNTSTMDTSNIGRKGEPAIVTQADALPVKKDLDLV